MAQGYFRSSGKLAVVMAIAGPGFASALAGLAEATSVITLCVFASVNAALFRIKGRGPGPAGTTSVPRWVPLAGLCASAGVLLFELATLLI